MSKDHGTEQDKKEMTRSQQIASSVTRVLDSAGESIPPQEEIERLADNSTAHDVLLLNKVNRTLTDIVSYMPTRTSHFFAVVIGAFRIAADELDVRRRDFAMAMFAAFTTFLIGITHVLASSFDSQMPFNRAYEVIYQNSAQHFTTISDALTALGIVSVPLVSIFFLILTVFYFVVGNMGKDRDRYRLLSRDEGKVEVKWNVVAILLAAVLSVVFLAQWSISSEASQGSPSLYAILTLLVLLPTALFLWKMFVVANRNTLFASFEEIRLEIRSAVLAYKLEAEAKGEEPDFVLTKKLGISDYNESLWNDDNEPSDLGD